MENKTELLLKIKLLAEKGSSGEKENAQIMLDKLMKKYDVGIDEIEMDVTSFETFRYKSHLDRQLLIQIVYMITCKGPSNCIKSSTQRKIKKLGCFCTKTQKIEIQINFDFYKNIIENDQEIFFSAFCMANDLYPKTSIDTATEMTGKERTESRKAAMMSRGLDFNTLRKQIETNE